MNYKIVTWPDIQDYMIKHPDYKEKTFFDADKNVWLIPECWDSDYLELKEVKENVFKSLMEESL